MSRLVRKRNVLISPLSPSLWPCLLVFVLVLFLLTACSGKSGNYAIGVISNFEGQNTKITIEAMAALNLAYQEFKAEYPDSFNIEIFPVDDSLDPVKIKTAYKAVRDKCDIIFSITSSNAFLAIYDDIRKNAEKLHVVIGPATSAISHQDDNVIRFNMDEDAEQKAMADFFTKRKVQDLLLVRENVKMDAYTQKAYGFFRTYFDGGITDTTFSAQDINLEHAIKALTSKDYDYVYILTGGTPREVGIVVQNLCALTPGLKAVPTQWNRDPILLESVGKYINNLILPAPIDFSKTNETYQHFAREFFKTHEYNPGYMAGATYDAVNILLRSIQKVGSTKADALKADILSETYNATTGKLKLNQFGDMPGKLFFYKVVGDRYVAVD